MDINILMR